MLRNRVVGEVEEQSASVNNRLPEGAGQTTPFEPIELFDATVAPLLDDGRKSGVYPGQDWIDPDGQRWHVDAIHWDGTERSAFLENQWGSVVRLPAALVAKTFSPARPLPLSEMEGDDA